MRGRGRLLVALAWLAGGAPAAEQAAFTSLTLPAASKPAVSNLTLTALVREPLNATARYELLVIPGSGCAGLAPIADRYFRGALHARVIVLHKPYVDPQGWPEPRCSSRFIEWDNLAAWRSAALAAITAYSREHPSDLPRWLVGISEGGELLPSLAAELPRISGLVLIGSPGIDPLDLAEMQAARLGATTAWRDVQRVSAGRSADSKLVQGRSLLYWRTLMNWPVYQPLLGSSLPVLQAWGTADEAVPQQAYERVEVMMPRWGRTAADYCALKSTGADHGLQSPGRDDLQEVWTRLEIRARGGDWCARSAASGAAVAQ